MVGPFSRGADTKNAVASLEAVAAKLPNLAAVHYHLGMSYAATGQAEKAKDQLNKAFSLEPDGTPLKEKHSLGDEVMGKRCGFAIREGSSRFYRDEKAARSILKPGKLN